MRNRSTRRAPTPLRLDLAPPSNATDDGSHAPSWNGNDETFWEPDGLDPRPDSDLRLLLENSLGLGGMGGNARATGQSPRSFEELLRPYFEERRSRQFAAAGVSVSQMRGAFEPLTDHFIVLSCPSSPSDASNTSPSDTGLAAYA